MLGERPKLTVGMAHFDDFDGVYFTIQSLRLSNSLPNVELIVVDNSPDSPAGREIKKLITNWVSKGNAGARYIPYSDAIGTTQSRNRIFQEANGEAVLCMDCHVMLKPGTIQRLIDWYDANPDCMDLLSGPMLYDDLETVVTQFDDTWRSEMWGTWGTDPRGLHPDGEPFEIFAMGLGLFTCRKDAWLGFNPHFRGFGGEECYIHEKYRQAGRKAQCLPFLRWAHRFGRPGGVKYPLTRWNKVRNYVLGHVELDLPLDPIREHFVGSDLMSQAQWDHLVADPIKHIAYLDDGSQKPGGCGGCGSNKKELEQSNLGESPTIEDLTDYVRSRPRDLNQHVDGIRAAIGDCKHVTSIVKRREWDPIVLSTYPETYISWQTEKDWLVEKCHEAWAKKNNEDDTERMFVTHHLMGVGAHRNIEGKQFQNTDVLILDQIMQADAIYADLTQFSPQVEKRIILRGTGAFGEHGEGAPQGILVGLRRFLRERPEWTVVEHHDHQYGWTMISQDKDDKRPLPSLVTMAWNYTKAMADAAAKGFPMAEEGTIQLRLDTCAMCSLRTENRCSKCGCYLDVGIGNQPGKAMHKDAECPFGFWAASEESGSPVVPLLTSPTK